MDRVMRRINVKTLSSISFGATAGTKPRMPINRKTTPNKSASVLAPQRQQVIDLARDGLAQTQTVRECLQRRDLAERAVVIVDEAGQIDGRQLLDLIRFIRDRNGRLILCGDTRQHGPVEA